MPMVWRPKLSGRGPLHERLVVALQRDIEAGALQPGDRLPPQRTLADDLRISVGTVTKSYQEAERLGLVTGQVGRGTFVKGGADLAGEPASESRVIDLSVNTTPLERATACLADTLRRLQRRPNAGELLAYAPPPGLEAHRKLACAWLARIAQFASADWSRLVITCGGQHAMSLAFASLCGPRDVILCEAATYYGMRALAEHAGYRLHGVAMDSEGIVPAAFDEEAERTGARTAYLMPTVQVPTARTMGLRRRQEIVEVARRRRITIVEDDNYPLFSPPSMAGLVPLADIAPDLCFYIGSVSKSLSPGLRTGFLIAPTQERFADVVRILRSTIYANSSFGPAVMAEWVEDGTGFDIAATMVKEVTARWKLAASLLDSPSGTAFPLAPHLWLSLNELETERVAGRAQRAGLTVTPPELPLLNPSLMSGLRVCLGAPRTRADVVLAMTRLRDALDNSQDRSANIFI